MSRQWEQQPTMEQPHGTEFCQQPVKLRSESWAGKGWELILVFWDPKHSCRIILSTETVREIKGVVLSHKFMVICYRIHKKQ